MTTLLVTRAQDQGQALCNGIEQLGHQAIHCPCIEIDAIDNQPSIEQADITIFTSTNAVRHTEKIIANTHGLILAIGPATATELVELGFLPKKVMLPAPEKFNSEGLLALEALYQQAVNGKTVTLVCGKNPRPLLTETLQQRGAIVQHLTTYRRQCPTDLSHILALEPDQIDCIILTSQAVLDNLVKMIEQSDQGWLYDLPLIVIRDTLADAAKVYRFSQPAHIADNSTDNAILACVQQVFG